MLVRLRECYIDATDLKKSATTKDWTKNPTLHALVVEYVFVPEPLRRKGLCRAFVMSLLDRTPFDVVVIEGVQTEFLRPMLTRSGFAFDATVHDYYFGVTPEAWQALDKLVPKPRITEVDRVANALLLTDAGMAPPWTSGENNHEADFDKLTKEVESWTDDQRAEAFEWAALSHLRANDNDDVVVPECPPHVQKMRPTYGKPAAT
jgi:hypothetical protein